MRQLWVAQANINQQAPHLTMSLSFVPCDKVAAHDQWVCQACVSIMGPLCQAVYQACVCASIMGPLSM